MPFALDSNESYILELLAKIKQEVHNAEKRYARGEVWGYQVALINIQNNAKFLIADNKLAAEESLQVTKR